MTSMQMEKRSYKLPCPLATKEQSKSIRQYLFDKGVSFSTYALEAVLEKMAKDQKQASNG